MKRLIILLGFLTLIAACDRKTTVENSEESVVNNEVLETEFLKVYVDENGEITADNKSVSLTQLDNSLKELKDKNGTVYYSRANMTQDPPAESMEVMDLVIKYELPIRFYTDKSFKIPVKM